MHNLHLVNDNNYNLSFLKVLIHNLTTYSRKKMTRGEKCLHLVTARLTSLAANTKPAACS